MAWQKHYKPPKRKDSAEENLQSDSRKENKDMQNAKSKNWKYSLNNKWDNNKKKEKDLPISSYTQVIAIELFYIHFVPLL